MNVAYKVSQTKICFSYNKLSQGATATKGALVDAGGKTVTVVKSAGSATAKKIGEIR